MGSEIASLFATIGADTGGLQSGLAGAKDAVSGFGSVAQTALGFVTGGIISKGLGLLSDAIGGIKGAMIDGNAEFERYETQFGVLLGSADAAKQRLSELADFGARTPFELPQVVKADKILQSFGLEADDTAKRFGMSGSDIRTVAGDMAAGTGAAFEDISSYLGKFASGATGEAISRMQQLGIVTRQQLSEMGLEFSKSGQLTSPVDESMTVLLKAMKTKFGGMMDAQSATFEGMLSNLQDWLGQTGRELGKPIFDVLKGSLQNLLGFLSSDAVKSGLSSIATNLAGGIQRVINVAGGLGDAVGMLSADFAAGETSDAVAKFGANILQTFGVSEEASYMFGDALGSVFSTIETAISPVTTQVRDFITAFQVGSEVDTLTGITNALYSLDDVSPIFDDIADAMVNAGGIIDGVGSAFSGLFRDLGQGNDVLGSVADFGANIAMAFGVGEDAAYEAGDVFVKAFDSLKGAVNSLAEGDTTPILTLLQSWADLFLGWVETNVIPFIGDKITALATSIGTWIATNAPIVGAQISMWANQFLNWVETSVIPFVGDKITAITTAIQTWITTNAPLIGTRLSEWGTSFLNWVDTDVIPFLSPKLDAIWTSIGTWIGTQKGLLDAKLAEWGQSFTDWIGGAAAALPGKMIEFWSSLYVQVQGIVTNLTTHQAELAESITNWISTKAIPWLRTEFPKFLLVLIGLIVAIPAALVITLAVVALAIINGIVDGMKKFIAEKVGAFLEMGRDFVNGLVDGINKASSAVFAAFVKIINDNIKAVKDFFGWHSPMPLTIDMGADMGIGLVNGLLSTGRMLKSTMLSVIDDATAGVNTSIPLALSTAYGAQAIPVTQGVSQSSSTASRQTLQATVVVNVGASEIKRELQEITLDDSLNTL